MIGNRPVTFGGLITIGLSGLNTWIHRDAPQPVKEALKLLAYSGIVTEHASGIRATRSEVGTRYAVNLGALIAQEGNPGTTGLRIARNLTPKRMSEFGANHPAYQSLLAQVPSFAEPEVGAVLQHQLAKPIEVLDVTYWAVYQASRTWARHGR